MAVEELADALAARTTRFLRDGGGDTRELREAIAELSGLVDLLDTIGYSGGR